MIGIYLTDTDSDPQDHHNKDSKFRSLIQASDFFLRPSQDCSNQCKLIIALVTVIALGTS